jgi:hypothetical protein
MTSVPIRFVLKPGRLRILATVLDRICYACQKAAPSSPTKQKICPCGVSYCFHKAQPDLVAIECQTILGIDEGRLLHSRFINDLLKRAKCKQSAQFFYTEIKIPGWMTKRWNFTHTLDEIEYYQKRIRSSSSYSDCEQKFETKVIALSETLQQWKTLRHLLQICLGANLDTLILDYFCQDFDEKDFIIQHGKS